ncbi:prepilin peptidase [Pseudaminobacter soli (ex Li et al. 2025)]|uniref:Prepilin peptidase n=1 Tax=Pseudaminobacter soli (ex Li et al. 2025) TaxID=1295366 RepID=A0A2P7S5D8_9HYPH|nr:prepilin peptidase [Mesorhizobium soli]PSJ57651.1 prepilin peptidase [Mesorhizobium soli]
MLMAVSILMKLIATPLLLKIGWKDFATQKIANSDVLLLLALGLASLFLAALAENFWWNLGLSAIAGALLFLLLFPFWLLRKIGAGDVKLLAVAPLVSGGADLLIFAIALLVFALITVTIVRNPMLLPSPAFRAYIKHLDHQRVVPFGVPISAALLVTIALQVYGLASRLILT